MKLCCIQMDMAFARPAENFSRAEALIRRAAAAGPDTIVLPELWNTGFFPTDNLPALCDPDAAQTCARLGGLAAELQINLAAGSVACLRDGRCFNTACVFDRSGTCRAQYDKLHRFAPMGEDRFFSPGDHLSLFRLDGVRCGVLICYDLRFPEAARAMAARGMDVLFLVCQWPAPRVDQLHALCRARAIENQCFVVCCNSCGTAGQTVYGGRSTVYDPLGRQLALAGPAEELLCAQLDLSAPAKARAALGAPVAQWAIGTDRILEEPV